MTIAHQVDREKIDGILNRYPHGEASSLVHLLQEMQAAFNWLPPETIRAVADHLAVPLTKAYSVATFYKAFSLRPRGRKIVKVCLGTSCHIRGASIVVEDIRQGLGIGPGETTADMAYTAEVVNCVGACALAPVVIADEKYLADVKPGTILKRLEKG
ncbi:MAG: NAD(P)H-dependent oxidoreductase subunit E [Myxococcota bacterium]|nr:NAD(P)H-dependent oxidoreductase subunit E [Myxococcota bacterium]